MTQEIFCLFNYQIVGVKWMLPLKHFMTIACSCHYHVRRLFVITLFVRSSIAGEDQKSPNLFTVTDLILLLRFNKNNFEKLLSCYGRGVNFPGKSYDKSLWKSCIDGNLSEYLNSYTTATGSVELHVGESVRISLSPKFMFLFSKCVSFTSQKVTVCCKE